MAATLATGEGAVLSHATAAAAWALRRKRSRVIHVTVAGRPGPQAARGHPGASQHDAHPARTTTLPGLPVTTPARTIIDLARTLEPRRLEHVVDLADQRGLVDFRDLRPANSASLQAVLRSYRPAPTRSELRKRRLLRLCDDHGIPRPERQPTDRGLRGRRGVARPKV